MWFVVTWAWILDDKRTGNNLQLENIKISKITQLPIQTELEGINIGGGGLGSNHLLSSPTKRY